MQKTKIQLLNLAQADETAAGSCIKAQQELEAEAKNNDARAKHYLARAKEYREAANLLPDTESDPAIMEGRF